MKSTIKYFRNGNLYECLLDYENITNIYVGCGSQSNRFGTCMFNYKSIILKMEKLLEVSQVADSVELKEDEKVKSQEEEWIECFKRNWQNLWKWQVSASPDARATYTHTHYFTRNLDFRLRVFIFELWCIGYVTLYAHTICS